MNKKALIRQNLTCRVKVHRACSAFINKRKLTIKSEHTLGFPGIQKKMIIAGLIALLSFLPSFVIAGQSSSSSVMLHVSATVRDFIDFQLHHQVMELVITGGDIRHGYLDVIGGTRYFIRTNVSEGYLLIFGHHKGPFKTITVSDGSVYQEVTSTGGSILITYSGGLAGELKELNYRFYLDSNAKPGTYSWPIPISTYTN